MQKKTVAVVFGGVSSEYEISLLSAASVIRNIPGDRYEIVLLGITRDGSWYLFNGGADAVEDGSWVDDKNNLPAVISPDRATHGVVVTRRDGSPYIIRLDAVFPVLHGRNGEDGRIQGLLELAAVPYVGCDVLSSAVCMDKAVANAMLDHFGVRRAPWAVLHRRELMDLDAHIKTWEAAFGWPMFVKPANTGSSVGISKVRGISALRDAVALAFEYDDKIVVEKSVAGTELECAVLGNGEQVASVVGEILPANEFYDYESKYCSAESETIIPARISEQQQTEIRRIAAEAFRLLGCTGMARVDFLVEESTGDIFLNELNTIPGFTSISMYPKMIKATGISYPELLSRLIELAIKRMA